MQDTSYADFGRGLAEFMENHGWAWTAAKIVGTGHARESELRRAASKAVDYLNGVEVDGKLDDEGRKVRDYLQNQNGACEIAAHDDSI